MAFAKEVLQEILKDYKNPSDFFGQNGIMKQLQKELIEEALGCELSTHLGYGKNQAGKKMTTNRRNGYSTKKIRTDVGDVEIEIPRDRDTTFEPKIIEKHCREIPSF